jgi:tetratricopeptide (TPR) repeat protein
MEPHVKVVRVAIVCAAAAIGAWALVHWVYRPYDCNRKLSALAARTVAAAETADGYQRTVRARRNLEELMPLREACPTAVRVPMLIGANEELVGRLEDAERSYRAALAIEPRPEIHVAIAKVAIQQGRVDDFVANYAAAVRFAPPILEEILPEELKKRVLRAAQVEAVTP